MKTNYQYKYYQSANSNKVNIILPGASEGLRSIFLETIFKKSQDSDYNTLSLSYPFQVRNEEKSSGPDLNEETQMLRDLFEKLELNKNQSIHIIAKSLGGIVASRFISALEEKIKSKIKITILGFILDDVLFENFHGEVNVIQGEFDKYGKPKEVEKYLSQVTLNSFSVNVIKGADHSYREPNTKEPIYQSKVLNMLKL